MVVAFTLSQVDDIILIGWKMMSRRRRRGRGVTIAFELNEGWPGAGLPSQKSSFIAKYGGLIVLYADLKRGTVLLSDPEAQWENMWD